MSGPADDAGRAGGPTLEALDADATRIGAELVRLDGGTDPFAAAVRATRMPMVVTDPRRFDNPIVFANGAFCRLTGYAAGGDRRAATAASCKGRRRTPADRGPAFANAVREARTSVEMDIRNHRKDGDAVLEPAADGAGAGRGRGRSPTSLPARSM